MSKIAALVIIALFALTGCDNSALPLPISTPVPSSTVESSPTTATPTREEVVRIQLPDSMLQDLLDEHHLAYPDPFSQGYPDILAVPVMVHYSADCLYYRSFEEMPFVGEKYSMTVPEEVNENLYEYNLSTREKIKIGDVSSSGYSSGNSLFTKDTFYTFSSTSQNALVIRGLDLESGKTQEIAQIENGKINVSFTQTDSGICAFLVEIENEGLNHQRLYTLNEEKNLKIIYDSAQIGLENPEFTALCSSDENLFLLRQTSQSGRLSTEVVEMDINGTELRTILLPDLQEYSDPEYYADKLYVQGDYIFIKWYYCGERLPYFSAFKLVDGKATEVAVPQNTPCYLLNDNPINGRYFLFSTFPDMMDYTVNTYTSHLYIFDTQYDRFIGISLPLARDIVFNDVVCNENGDIIMNIVESTDSQAPSQKRTVRIAFGNLKSICQL